MQGAEERRLRRMSNTPQGGAIEGNAADDALMVDQGISFLDISSPHVFNGPAESVRALRMSRDYWLRRADSNPLW